MKIRLPVRSAIYKHDTGGLVVRWVTTSESPLLYVFAFFLPFFLVVDTAVVAEMPRIFAATSPHMLPEVLNTGSPLSESISQLHVFWRWPISKAHVLQVAH